MSREQAEFDADLLKEIKQLKEKVAWLENVVIGYDRRFEEIQSRLASLQSADQSRAAAAVPKPSE